MNRDSATFNNRDSDRRARRSTLGRRWASHAANLKSGPLGLGLLLILSLVSRAVSAAPDYLSEIQPLLRDRCYACHGALKQKAGLRVDTVAFLKAGGKSGPAIRPGNASESLLVRRIESRDSDERMPPEHEGELFGAAQAGRIRAWLEAGAVGPADEVPEADPREHWAFRKPVSSKVPEVTRADWVRNPIDAFVARAHQDRGLVPQPEASRATLVRRLYVDLIGLPPSWEESARVDADTQAGWYERLVDRLLQDPRYGERWARHWMDIWRYSDWWGLGDQLRNSQRHIWRWRDWIVESLNGDIPYDAMIRQMLAADELYPDDPDRLRATGYLARNYFLFNRNQWMDEVVEHVGKGILGLTLNCAKCHDHKYDPIGQAEYFRMRAFFEPYHARVDVVPGEPDGVRDGLPRVFDGRVVPPTYRFIRGQENQPDKSTILTPAVPEFLAFREVAIQPVSLPVTAWQPERRPWVFEAYRKAATGRLDAAQRAMADIEAKRTLARNQPADLNSGNEVEASHAVAVEELALRRAESESLEWRIAAMRAGWDESDAEVQGSGETRRQTSVDAQRLAVQAVRSEREVAVARARHGVATARKRWLTAKDDARKTAQAEWDKAGETLEKALTETSAGVSESARYSRLVGAAWTPTRFFDSTKDDPAVEWGPVSTGRRKALAEWLTDPGNPLTARVAVNHVWNRHFGTPLVATVFDFGRKGAMPTHPELLDWLATEWVAHGWSFKHLHRLIVTSSTYRMESSGRGGDANAVRDPDNRYLWRRAPIRMEAQVIRDSILTHSGELDSTMGGPSVPLSEQGESKRRSLYFYHSNNERNLFLTTFDEATVKECYRRETSIVPQQALALTNSRLVQDAAWRVAERLTGRLGAGTGAEADEAFVRKTFQVLLGYEPSGAELAASMKGLEAWRALPPTPGVAEGWRGDARAGLVWALLNHDDFVTLR